MLWSADGPPAYGVPRTPWTGEKSPCHAMPSSTRFRVRGARKDSSHRGGSDSGVLLFTGCRRRGGQPRLSGVPHFPTPQIPPPRRPCTFTNMPSVQSPCHGMLWSAGGPPAYGVPRTPWTGEKSPCHAMPSSTRFRVRGARKDSSHRGGSDSGVLLFTGCRRRGGRPRLPHALPLLNAAGSAHASAMHIHQHAVGAVPVPCPMS